MNQLSDRLIIKLYKHYKIDCLGVSLAAAQVHRGQGQ